MHDHIAFAVVCVPQICNVVKFGRYEASAKVLQQIETDATAFWEASRGEE